MNLETQEKFANEISKFKSKIFKKYKIRLYIHSKAVDDASHLALPELWDLFIAYIAENCPEYNKYTNFKKKTRRREWVTIYQCFVYIAYNKLGFYKNEIARFTNRNHATVINSLNKVEIYLDTEDILFMPIYNNLMQKYKDYVRAISENTEI